MNVSFDASRPFYAAYNEHFERRYFQEHKRKVKIKQTHGGSGKQARAVIDGLQADVVTLALSQDIDALNEKAMLVDKAWQSRLPNGSSPFTSTIVLLVRHGNPKQIHDFSDLARPDVSVITPNPKTSGGARLGYLAAWAYARRQPGGSDESARAFVKSVFSHVPVMDSGARGALTTFLERNIGDVLIAWENEAIFASREMGRGKVEVVTPTVSILAEPPVSVVDAVTAKHQTQGLAEAYLKGLWEPEAQMLAVKSHFRPRDPTLLAQNRSQFPELTLVSVQEAFGGWANAQKTHFAEGGVFDQMIAKP